MKSKKLFLYSLFFTYFFAHAIFWWKGLFGSIGTVRVIAGVLPLAAVISLEGYNFLVKLFSKNTQRYVPVGALVILLVWFVGNKIVPVRLSTEEKVVWEASEWLAQSNNDKNKMYYFYPWVSVILNRDKFDKTLNEEPLGLNDTNNVKNIPAGSLLIWDSHFSANEGRISKESIFNSKNFKLLKQFKSDKLWTDLDKSIKYFEVNVFKKVN